MKFKQQDFANAVADYNTRFNQAIQIYNIFDREEDEAIKDAKSNLEVWNGMLGDQIKSGEITFDQITSVQKAAIEDLEIQSGIPVGSTLAVLQTLKEDEEVLYRHFNPETGTFTYITKDASGDTTTTKIAGVEPPEGTTTAKFTPTQLLKLEQAGLKDAPRETQLDFLFKDEEVVYNAKNLPGDVRNSIIEDLQDKEYAIASGELTIEQLSILYPEVNLETLQGLMDQFYDFDSLVADETKDTGKKWYEFWKSGNSSGVDSGSRSFA